MFCCVVHVRHPQPDKYISTQQTMLGVPSGMTGFDYRISRIAAWRFTLILPALIPHLLWSRWLLINPIAKCIVSMWLEAKHWMDCRPSPAEETIWLRSPPTERPSEGFRSSNALVGGCERDILKGAHANRAITHLTLPLCHKLPETPQRTTAGAKCQGTWNQN